MNKSAVFEETYTNYLNRIAELDFAKIAGRLGAELVGSDLIVPVFGKPHRISNQGLSDPSGNRPDFSVCVVLFKYLLLCPEVDPFEDDWVSFKDFKDAAPFAGSFINYTETPLAKHFAGNLDRLEVAARVLCGQPPAVNFPYDLCMQFFALPKVPVLMLFNDADEEFAARCAVLFERRAEKYLDMECLAMVGMLLFERLKMAAR
ncbi:MAG: DUF3786 domain-containing protein [Desulfobacterales bacterium]|jgi:hypothetical protein|nr:DUF3786 domain-containing protein [Deltaproteobacteria bacterium]